MAKHIFPLLLYYLQIFSIVSFILSLFTCKLYISSQTQIKRAHLRLETLTHYVHFLLLESSSIEIENVSNSQIRTQNLYKFYWAEYSELPQLMGTFQNTFGNLLPIDIPSSLLKNDLYFISVTLPTNLQIPDFFLVKKDNCINNKTTFIKLDNNSIKSMKQELNSLYSSYLWILEE